MYHEQVHFVVKYAETSEGTRLNTTETYEIIERAKMHAATFEEELEEGVLFFLFVQMRISRPLARKRSKRNAPFEGNLKQSVIVFAVINLARNAMQMFIARVQ